MAQRKERYGVLKTVLIHLSDWHNRFKAWKPIHLCWWFEKHGWSIPPYLIGGQPVTDGSNYGHSDDDNGDPDGWSVIDGFLQLTSTSIRL